MKKKGQSHMMDNQGYQSTSTVKTLVDIRCDADLTSPRYID